MFQKLKRSILTWLKKYLFIPAYLHNIVRFKKKSFSYLNDSYIFIICALLKLYRRFEEIIIESTRVFLFHRWYFLRKVSLNITLKFLNDIL